MHETCPSKKQRAQGKPGAQCTRSLACESDKAQEQSHYRFTGNIRPSLRNGLRLIARSPRRPGFLATVACASYRRLDPSVAGSGPHAFAVRKIALSSLAPPASTASRPAFRDDREPPLCVGRDAEKYTTDLGLLEIGIFLQKGLDMPQSEHDVICPSAQFCGARRASMSETGLIFPIHSSMSSNLFNIRTSADRLAS
jgi:hypothetical protein